MLLSWYGDRQRSLSHRQRWNSAALLNRVPCRRLRLRAKLILMLAEGASFNTIKRQLQTSAPPSSAGSSASSNPGSMGSIPIIPVEGHGSDSGSACRILSATRKKPSDGPRIGVAANWRRRWESAKTPCIGLERSRSETPPPGAFLGQRRSRVRKQSGRHHRPVSAAAATCRRVLRR